MSGVQIAMRHILLCAIQGCEAESQDPEFMFGLETFTSVELNRHFLQ